MKLPRYPYEWKEKGPKLEIRIGPRVASGNSVDSDGPEEGRGPDPTQPQTRAWLGRRNTLGRLDGPARVHQR
jgi:hypothetical protein